jgi:hypothetical protein
MVIDRDIMGALPNRINEEMYNVVNDDEKLKAYFEEDPKVHTYIHTARSLPVLFTVFCMPNPVTGYAMVANVDYDSMYKCRMTAMSLIWPR